MDGLLNFGRVQVDEFTAGGAEGVGGVGVAQADNRHAAFAQTDNQRRKVAVI